ncbi:putative transcription factor bZIP family [Helianthus anomalus]
MKNLKASKTAEAAKVAAGDDEGDDSSSSSSSEEETDENECAKRIKAEIEKEKQLKRRGERRRMMMCIFQGITLEEIGDFNFSSDVQVKNLEKKVEEVLVEKKKLLDREKKLEKRVKSVEAENTSLLKKIEADQTDIDILKVKVAELEEEKARRDEQNKYFELKNKKLEAAKAMKEHEIYMMNKVLQNMLGKSIE